VRREEQAHLTLERERSSLVSLLVVPVLCSSCCGCLLPDAGHSASPTCTLVAFGSWLVHAPCLSMSCRGVRRGQIAGNKRGTAGSGRCGFPQTSSWRGFGSCSALSQPPPSTHTAARHSDQLQTSPYTHHAIVCHPSRRRVVTRDFLAAAVAAAGAAAAAAAVVAETNRRCRERIESSNL
jgi:hypothetical protein